MGMVRPTCGCLHPSFLHSSIIFLSHRTDLFLYFVAPPNLYYNQQQQQHLPMSTAASSTPVSTFSPHHPSQPTSTPPSTASQPQPTMKSASPGLEASKPSGQSVPPSLEAQRVTALLELNSVLLQEVVNLQNAGKADVSTQPQQPSPPHEQGSGTLASGQRTQQPSPPEDKGSTTPAASQRGQPSGKVTAPKDYIEYGLVPLPHNPSAV